MYNKVNFTDSVLLLLPLCLLALCSYALDQRFSHEISEELREFLLQASRAILPAFMAMATAFLVPTSNRGLQLWVVALCYTLLYSAARWWFPNLVYYPTACVISAVTPVLLLLPEQNTGTLPDRELLNPEARHYSLDKLKEHLGILAGIILLPLITCLLMMAIASQIERLVALTFNDGVEDVIFATLAAPAFTSLMTLGFNGAFFTMSTLDPAALVIGHIADSAMLTCLISLPAVLLCKSLFCQGSWRLFTALMAFCALLVSHVGTCVSLELALVMLFLPGTFCSLLVSSALLYLCCSALNCPALTSLTTLYRPDLILYEQALTDLRGTTLYCALAAALLPVSLMCFLELIRGTRLLPLKVEHKTPNTPSYPISRDGSADLQSFVLLRSLGGLNNLREVFRQGRELVLKVADLQTVSLSSVQTISNSRVRLDHQSLCLICDVGENCYLIEKRLQNMLKDRSSDDRYSQPFNIGSYVRIRELINSTAQD
ncbi:MAG: hypothetical protein IJ228_02895 [Succinivibrio sp.]|nr:hypothetical protein [Succinivibrio sp.]